MCQNCKSETGCICRSKSIFLEENVASDMLRRRRSASKSQRKEVRKDQLHDSRSLHNWVVNLKVFSEKVFSFYVNLECWDRNTPSNSQRALGTPKKIGNLCAPNFGERSREDLATRKTRPQSTVGFGKIFTSSRMRTQLRFTLLLKQEECQHPLRKVRRSENSSSTQKHQCT